MIDSSLTTVGVWADSSRGISSRNWIGFIGYSCPTDWQTSISTTGPTCQFLEEKHQRNHKEMQPISTGPVEIETEITQTSLKSNLEPETSTEISPSYGRVCRVLLEGQKLSNSAVSICLIVSIWRKEILKEGRGVNGISRCVRLFNVEEVA